ncbi:urease accessory protein UreD [Actinoplanes sp. NPDC051633]|uniref:urease accessory protein UreD n=1 Tax=Actinoplanes sp. NPDC051633 TaxID=3155670 RepID=UPI0034403A49
MRAAARIVAEADRSGGTRLAVLRGESPLLFRRTGPRNGGRGTAAAGGVPGSGTAQAITLHLVGGAAGPLRGDELRLDLEVGPHARLDVRSVAATLLLPGRPAPPSTLVIHAEVGEGATLRWLPEPTIAAAGCDHIAITLVEVAEGGTLLWRDDIVCGRHREESGRIRTETTVRYAGRALYRHDLAIGAPGWEGAAVLGGNRALGAAILAGPDLPEPHLPGPDAAVMSLPGPGLLATAAGADIRRVRAVIDPICESYPAARSTPAPATKW